MKHTKNIALIGMPGCYKTTAGKILAEILARDFYDTDEIYERVYGETIGATFEKEGEETFRNRETVVLREVCRKESAVIATGGGIILRPENIQALQQTCFTVELFAAPTTIFGRLKSTDNRPLLKQMNILTIEQLYASRENLYRSAADMRICTDNRPPARIADLIAALVTEAAE